MRLQCNHHTLLAISLMFCATGAMAQDGSGYYVKGFGGLSALQGDTFALDGTSAAVSYDTGATYGGAVGYDYGDRRFRAELEFAYRTGDASGLPVAIGTSGDFASTTVMLNGYYMFETASNLRPYAGLGIGYVTEIDFDIEGGAGAGEYSDRGLIAYQAMVGAEYPLANRLSVYGEARYFTAGTADMTSAGGSALSADYDTFDLNAGLALRF
jgi:opacity protein-like surface antigen